MASTLILSAVVVSVVGWFLLQQTRDGLLDQRVDAVVAEAKGEVREAEVRLDAASGLDADATRQQQDLADPIIARGEVRDFSVVLTGPSGQGLDLDDSGAVYTTGLDTASVPGVHGAAVRRDRRHHRVDLHHDPHRGGRADHRATGDRGRLAGAAAGRRAALHALLPVPPGGAGGDPRPGHPGACHRRRPPAGPGRRHHLAGHPAGRHPDPDGPAGRRAAGRRPAAGAAAGLGRGRPRSPRARRSTRWPATCSARSGSSRS